MVGEYPETHQQGTISIENIPQELRIPGYMPHILESMKGDFGVQIAKDGRVWVCINGIAFLRFSPHADGKMSKLADAERGEHGKG
jgi:sugar lactone lactonase YvrE